MDRIRVSWSMDVIKKEITKLSMEVGIFRKMKDADTFMGRLLTEAEQDFVKYRYKELLNRLRMIVGDYSVVRKNEGAEVREIVNEVRKLIKRDDFLGEEECRHIAETCGE